MTADSQTAWTLPPSGAFVFLEHQYPPPQDSENHWDLMFETHAGLVTFATAPLLPGGSAGLARLLPVHRLAYLNYEGPISNRRGHVRRLDRGQFKQVEHAAQGLIIEVSGQMFVGRLVLRPVNDQDIQDAGCWRLQWTPLPYSRQ